MTGLRRSTLALVAALLVAVVGLVDAIAGHQGDLVVLFLFVAALLLMALAWLRTDGRAVRLRPDLAAWISEQAVATGEPAERIAARCIAAYRAGMAGDERR